MLKTLGGQVKEFKKDSILTPVFMILEVIMETIIPLIMGSIIDDGVQKGNLTHIYLMGALMVLYLYRWCGDVRACCRRTLVRSDGRQVWSQSINRICEKSA